MQVGEVVNYNRSLYKLGSYLITWLYPLAVLSGFHFSLSRHRRWISSIPILLTFVISIIFIKRFTLFTVIGLWFLSALYSSYFSRPNLQKLLRKQLLMISGLVIFALFGFSYWIVSLRSFYLKDIAELFKENIYSYFAGTLSALEKYLLIHGDEPMSMGVSSFRSVMKWLAKLGLFERDAVQVVHSDFVNIGTGHRQYINTYTYVKVLFEDFGIIGVFFVSTVWGGFTRYANQRLSQKFTLKSLMLLAVLNFSLIMTFYEFYFEGISTIILWFLYMSIVEYYLKRSSSIKVVSY
jgi:oligosaccharide repeat unit polymerase